MSKAKMVVDMHLVKTIQMGVPGIPGLGSSLAMDTDGTAGVLYVYKSKRAALRDGCKNQYLRELEICE